MKETSRNAVWIAVAAMIFIFAALLLQSFLAEDAWQRQPQAIKAAAVARERAIKANVHPGDFIRMSDGSLKYVVSNGDESLRLRSDFDVIGEDYNREIWQLARQGAVLICQNETAYKDAAVEFIKPSKH